jgi:hypothetical protein
MATLSAALMWAHRRFYLAVLTPFTTTVQTLHSEMIRNDKLHIKPYEVKGTQFL